MSRYWVVSVIWKGVGGGKIKVFSNEEDALNYAIECVKDFDGSEGHIAVIKKLRRVGVGRVFVKYQPLTLGDEVIL